MVQVGHDGSPVKYRSTSSDSQPACCLPWSLCARFTAVRPVLGPHTPGRPHRLRDDDKTGAHATKPEDPCPYPLSPAGHRRPLHMGQDVSTMETPMRHIDGCAVTTATSFPAPAESVYSQVRLQEMADPVIPEQVGYVHLKCPQCSHSFQYRLPVDEGLHAAGAFRHPSM